MEQYKTCANYDPKRGRCKALSGMDCLIGECKFYLYLPEGESAPTPTVIDRAERNRRNTARWRKEMRESGRCIMCGKSVTQEGYATCSACRERNTERLTKVREERIWKRLCVVCGKPVVNDNHKTCAPCREKFKMKREEKKRERMEENPHGD